MVNLPAKTGGKTYRKAVERKENGVWKQLASLTVADAANRWLDTLTNAHTRRAYRAGLEQLAERGIVNPLDTLQHFALRNHNSALDNIKAIGDWTEATRQARAALYCAFTGFLARRTDGIVRKATPSREGTSKTFFRVRDTVATPAMNRREWGRFLDHLDKINRRDGLIARLMLQGGKRISEVLGLETETIDWAERQITYRQAKTGGRVQETIITLPQHVMDALQDYLGDRTGRVFLTRAGKPVQPTQLVRTFALAGSRAGIPFPVTPHVLRASTVTYLKREGFGDTSIMKVTGHASAQMVASYDKNGLAENASQKVNLV